MAVIKTAEFDYNKIIGFRNLGNTCFLNSVLQNLVATIPLQNYFIAQNAKENIKESSMEKVLRQTFNAISGKNSIFNPKLLFNAVKKSNSSFKGNSQQDAHELFCLIMGQIEKENRKINAKKIFEHNKNLIEKWDFKTVKYFLKFCEIELDNNYEIEGQDIISLINALPSKNAFIKLCETLGITKNSSQKIILIECLALFDGSSNFLRKYVLENDFQKTYFLDNLALPNLIFGGVLESSILCLKCNFKSVIFETFNALSLPIKINKNHLGKKIEEKIKENSKIKNKRKSKKFKKNQKIQKTLQDLRKKFVQNNEFFNKKSSVLTLNECLQNFTAPELLHFEHSFECTNCSQNENDQNISKNNNFNNILKNPKNILKNGVKLDDFSFNEILGGSVIKKYSFKILPQVLVIQLKRFNVSHSGLSKSEEMVDFPFKLEINLNSDDLKNLNVGLKNKNGGKNEKEKSQNLNESSFIKKSAKKYLLYGVVVHIGGLRSGHYVAYCYKGKFCYGKNKIYEEKKWCRFSDENCKIVDLECVKQTKPYLLFYQKINDF